MLLEKVKIENPTYPILDYNSITVLKHILKQSEILLQSEPQVLAKIYINNKKNKK